MECFCTCHTPAVGVNSTYFFNDCCSCARHQKLEESPAKKYLRKAIELAEYLGEIAALLPSNCDGDEECGSRECPACHAFKLCREFREVKGSE